MKVIKSSQILISITAVVGLVAAFSLLHNQTSLILSLLALTIILAIMFYRPIVALYLIAVLYPFAVWQFIYGEINVPYVDLVALLLLLVFAIQVLVKFVQGELQLDKDNFPAWFIFSFFLIAGALSLINVDRYFLGDSVKYLFRPILFFYLAYLVVPIYYIRSKQTLLRIMKIIFWLGVVMAVGGLYRFIFFDPSLGLRRALPFGWGSFYPLGFNHNLLSEALVPIVPIGLGLFWLERDLFKRNVYLILSGFIALVSVLTLSRAGWLALLVTLLLLIYLLGKKLQEFSFYKIWLWLTGLSIVPVIILLYLLNTTAIAQGSNLNRLKLIEIAWKLFLDHPLVGAGVGTYFRSVEQIRWYIIEYGGALDAHGYLFKVMAEMGILGLLSFIAFLAYLLWYVWSNFWQIKNREWSIIIASLLCSSVAMLVFEWFNTSYYLAKMWIFFGLTLAGIKILKDLNLIKK